MESQKHQQMIGQKQRVLDDATHELRHAKGGGKEGEDLEEGKSWKRGENRSRKRVDLESLEDLVNTV
jgi:hypothetical protein